MGYDTLDQEDRDESHSTSPSPVHLASPNTPQLFLDDTRNREKSRNAGPGRISGMLDSLTSKTIKSSYDIVEADDYNDPRQSPPGISNSKSPEPLVPIPRRPTRPRLSTQATAAAERAKITSPSLSSPSDPIVRTASGRILALRHPTPDLQVLQGAYTGNIEHLERTAERLSMTSSIDDAIRELHAEQKRNDSRRSSLLSSPELPSMTRQVSNASSIVETNNLARSGGYSPAGFMMSPNSSFTNGGRGRSASKSSRFASRPEPELEGRPLDSFVNTSSGMSPSIAERDEGPTTLTRPVVVGLLDSNPDLELRMPETRDGPPEEKRPTTSASNNTYDQAQLAFADFDGVHSEFPQRSFSGGDSNNGMDNPQRRVISTDRLSSMAGSESNGQRRVSSNDRLSVAQPQSYADPNTGQQMIYYPAPVPMMLNLPQKLSKMPSSMARNKRRSQILSSIPPAARQSAIWLPDVLEIEDEPNLPEDDGAQNLEYVAQHQRATMGGRRLTQDVQHLPPQLRANAFFDTPGINQVVELKEQSAVATLDSILDASAHAPVSAFTDHLIAGHLGAEIYGKPKLRNSRSSSHLLVEDKSKKRTSSFNLLRGRRTSSSNLGTEDEKRRNTIADIRDGKILRDEDDEDELREEDDEEEDGEEEEEEIYTGAPTTLLAELQIRKQQAKNRTRPLAGQYPNGMHSTLLELDSVAQVEKKARQHKRVNLAWEDPAVQEPDDEGGDDEDVPLALLYAKKSQVQDPNRPMGLMERRDMEDNEPLSKRRDRLQGRKPAMNRASTMMNLTSGVTPEEEEETLADRVRRLKDQGRSATGLPSARPVSGDFASEMMSQFGGDLLDGKAKVPVPASPSPGEEEETLGQRRKRLQAEKEARAKEVGIVGEAMPRPPLQTRRSMADLLAAHPSAGASRVASYSKPPSGLLGLHEKASAQRSSSMLNLNQGPSSGQNANAGGFRAGMYNDGQGGFAPPTKPQMQRNSSTNLFQQFPQPSLGYGFNNQMAMPFANPYAMAYPNAMNGMPMSYTMPNMNMQQGMPFPGMPMMTEPLNQGQIDMVERWRQSVMQ